MVIVDKPMPEKCAGCWAMRCSKCIISDSKNIMEYQSNGTKPTWCPVKADVDKMVSKLDYEIQVTESMAGDDEWFKGKIYGIDSVISLLKDPTIKESDIGYTGTCPKCRASILSGVEITKCWHCGTSVKLHKLDKKSEDCISRRAVLEYIEGSEAELGHSSENELVCQDIKELPSVTPKQRTGHWIIISPTDMYCSECNEIEHLDTSRKFCAYCGTKMVGAQESGEV